MFVNKHSKIHVYVLSQILQVKLFTFEGTVSLRRSFEHSSKHLWLRRKTQVYVQNICLAVDLFDTVHILYNAIFRVLRNGPCYSKPCLL